MQIAQDPAESALKEVDLNLAYGKYDLAEEQLKKVIDQAPLNHGAKLKLAELYFMSERMVEFIAIAEELHLQHRPTIDKAQWGKLLDMGKVIAPEHPLFSGPQLVKDKEPKPAS